MHPKALLDACAELVKLTLKFDHPADAVVSRYFRDNRSLGPRERATLAETVYTVLRKKLLFDHLSPSGSGPKERRMAILGFHGPRDFLKSALTEQEKNWLDQCDAINPADLLERHRHNLPEWLVQPLKDQLGAEFWPLVESLQPARAAGPARQHAHRQARPTCRRSSSWPASRPTPTPLFALGPAAGRQAGADQARRFRPRRDRGAGRRLAVAGAAAGRQARRDGGRFLRRRRRQDAGHRRGHAQHRPALRLRHLGAPAGCAQAAAGAQQAVQRPSGRDRPRARRAHQAAGRQDRPGAWSMRRVRAWARCGAIPT